MGYCQEKHRLRKYHTDYQSYFKVTNILAIWAAHVVRIRWHYPMDERDAPSTNDNTALFFFHAGKFGPGYHIPAMDIQLPDAARTVTVSSSGHVNTNSSQESIGMRTPGRHNIVIQIDE